mgnify:CR=1 FL=1
MRKKETKRAINFDLDTKELLKHFKNTHQAYSAIKVFMEDNGFEHRQYSGYVSREPTFLFINFLFLFFRIIKNIF